MTPFLENIANLLERQLRPGLADFVARGYRERAGSDPSVMRVKELVDGSMDAMRLELERCFDLKLETGAATAAAITAIRVKLSEELDKEFPRIVLSA